MLSKVMNAVSSRSNAAVRTSMSLYILIPIPPIRNFFIYLFIFIYFQFKFKLLKNLIKN